jgi:Na+-translocating ferredoxin:NAD+ oxidoreductase RnfA subunit
MTNDVYITNFVFMVSTNCPVLVTFGDWSYQSWFFFSGLSYGLPLALGFAVVLGVLKAVRPPRFPTNLD